MSSEPFAYAVRRSDRARRVRVTVDPQRGVEVVLPRRAPARAAGEAVVELAPWIERRLAEQARVRAALADRGETVPYLGQALELVAEPGRTRAHRRGDRLLVPGAAAERAQALERFYRRAAREEIAPRVALACAQAGVACARITIRAQRTRWGSCSRSGTLSFNWRLLLGPADVLDYVVWHEVCHLAVMDHSPRFWALLARHMPGYHEPRRWLRRNGAMLAL
jgi:predicted metal-dependent hydrolase